MGRVPITSINGNSMLGAVIAAANCQHRHNMEGQHVDKACECVECGAGELRPQPTRVLGHKCEWEQKQGIGGRGGQWQQTSWCWLVVMPGWGTSQCTLHAAHLRCKVPGRGVHEVAVVNDDDSRVAHDEVPQHRHH